MSAPLRATASAGASVGNVGPGFDVLGLALAEPRDRVTAERTDTGRVELVSVTGDEGRLSRDAGGNCAGVAASAVLSALGPPGAGVRLTLEKGLPLGSGMGSSGASAVAAAFATAALFGREGDRALLLDACREGERLATGSPHPDNVAPSLFGGVVACLPRGGGAVEVLRLPVPHGLSVAVVRPGVEVRTADARAALPAAVPMADVVWNLAAVAGLVAALHSGDLALLGRSLEDRVAVPYRRRLVPGYDAAVLAARAAGALGAALSGSGPTVFALADSSAVARRAAEGMIRAFEAEGLGATGIVTAVDPGGARLEEG